MLNMEYVAGNLAKKTPHGSALGGGEHIYIYVYICVITLIYIAYTCIPSVNLAISELLVDWLLAEG